MARLLKNNVTGAVGNLIFYEFRGNPVARTKPTRVKQTKATKSAAKDFGRAVRYSRQIRNSLEGLIDPKDKPMMYRLNKELLQWLRESKGDSTMMAENILRLESFDFNEDSRLGRCLRFKPVVDFSVPGKIFVDIPTLQPSPDIMAPRDTQTIEWTIMAVRCNTSDKSAKYTDPPEEYFKVLNMDYNTTRISAQRLELPFPTIPGDVVLLVIGLKYFTMREKKLGQVMEKRWLPAGVVGVCYKV